MKQVNLNFTTKISPSKIAKKRSSGKKKGDEQFPTSGSKLKQHFKAQFESNNLKDKLEVYKNQIMQKMEKGTASDNIDLLQNFKSPLQRFVHEADTDGLVITKDIIDFDRNFFMNQLTTLRKSYNEEIRSIYIKTREKAIKYVEI
jgi:hypothetical protein